VLILRTISCQHWTRFVAVSSKYNRFIFNHAMLVCIAWTMFSQDVRRLSVCLSVTHWYSVETVKHI